MAVTVAFGDLRAASDGQRMLESVHGLPRGRWRPGWCRLPAHLPLQRARQLQRRLAAVLHDNAFRLLSRARDFQRLPA